MIALYCPSVFSDVFYELGSIFLEFQLFNHQIARSESKRCIKWSTKSIEVFENYNRISCAAYFEATHFEKGCFHGKLTFEMDLSHVLVDYNFAIGNYNWNEYIFDSWFRID